MSIFNNFLFKPNLGCSSFHIRFDYEWEKSITEAEYINFFFECVVMGVPLFKIYTLTIPISSISSFNDIFTYVANLLANQCAPEGYEFEYYVEDGVVPQYQKKLCMTYLPISSTFENHCSHNNLIFYSDIFFKKKLMIKKDSYSLEDINEDINFVDCVMSYGISESQSEELLNNIKVQSEQIMGMQNKKNLNKEINERRKIIDRSIAENINDELMGCYNVTKNLSSIIYSKLFDAKKKLIIDDFINFMSDSIFNKSHSKNAFADFKAIFTLLGIMRRYESKKLHVVNNGQIDVFLSFAGYDGSVKKNFLIFKGTQISRIVEYIPYYLGIKFKNSYVSINKFIDKQNINLLTGHSYGSMTVERIKGKIEKEGHNPKIRLLLFQYSFPFLLKVNHFRYFKSFYAKNTYLRVNNNSFQSQHNYDPISNWTNFILVLLMIVLSNFFIYKFIWLIGINKYILCVLLDIMILLIFKKTIIFHKIKNIINDESIHYLDKSDFYKYLLSPNENISGLYDINYSYIHEVIESLNEENEYYKIFANDLKHGSFDFLNLFNDPEFKNRFKHFDEYELDFSRNKLKFFFEGIQKIQIENHNE